MKLDNFFIPYVVILAFIFLDVFASGGVGWYETLTLPSWHPAVALISVVWAAIYFCAGWSLLIVWNKTPRDTRTRYTAVGFTVGALLNLAWSVSFFSLHLLSFAPWFALLLGANALVLIGFIYTRSKKAALLLVPYAVWVFFAAYLTYSVFLLNA